MIKSKMKKKLLIYILFILVQFCLYPGNNKNLNKDHISDFQIKERIILLSDKETYFSGESAFFHIYCYEESLNIKMGLSKIAYVELYNQDNTPVSQIKISLNNGFGNGKIDIPKNAETDYYFIRAYTNYMKNEGAEIFFNKRIQVINLFYQLDLKESKNKSTFNSYTVALFPESGKLYNGVNNNVSFRVDTDEKYFKAFKAILTNQNNQVIVDSVTVNQNGFGQFAFIPVYGQKYIFKSAIGNKIIETKLPEIKNEGLYFQLSRQNEDTLWFNIFSKENSQFPLSVIVENSGIKSVIKNNIGINIKNIAIPKNKLPYGISDIILFNKNGVSTCERMVFNSKKDNIKIEIESEKTVGFRDKVSVRVKTMDKNNNPLPTFVCAGVNYLIDSIQYTKYDPFYKAKLKSELSRLIGIYNYSIINDLVMHEDQMNIALICAKKESEIKLNKLNYLPEINGDIISGKINNLTNNSDIANKQVFLSFIDSVSFIEISTTNTFGEFYFMLSDNPPCADMVVTITDTLSKFRLELDPEFFTDYIPIKKERYIPDIKDLEKLKQAKINLQVSDAFETKTMNKLNVDNYKYDFFGIPTHKYYFSDYVNLPNMDEFIFEIVSGVRAHKRKDKVEFRIIETDAVAFKESPLVMFDGVPYFYDDKKILSLKPEMLNSISTVEEKYYYGEYSFYGVIDIKSKTADFSLLDWPKNSFSYDFTCIQDFENNNIGYTKKTITNNSNPLYNNLLYWNPLIETNSAGEAEFIFYTGDYRGEFVIDITAFTIETEFQTCKSIFEIK